MQSTATQWTAESVRDILPNVRILVDGVEVRGCVKGRKLQFANVYREDRLTDAGWEFAWQSIANCLNADRPLRV